MTNPTISFRLSEFHLARALHIIRQLEPNYQIISPSNIVKTVFFDYIAKMNLNQSPDTPTNIVIELDNFLHGDSKAKKELSLGDLIEMQQKQEKPEEQESEEKSVISSVTDFSPPEDWDK